MRKTIRKNHTNKQIDFFTIIASFLLSSACGLGVTAFEFIWCRRSKKNPNWTAKLPEAVSVAGKNFPPGMLVDAELYAEGGEGIVVKKFRSKYRGGDSCPEATEFWRKFRGSMS